MELLELFLSDREERRASGRWNSWSYSGIMENVHGFLFEHQYPLDKRARFCLKLLVFWGIFMNSEQPQSRGVMLATCLYYLWVVKGLENTAAYEQYLKMISQPQLVETTYQYINPFDVPKSALG
jgi:hypothetical protein